MEPFKRRTLLAGAAGAGLALTFEDVLHAQPALAAAGATTAKGVVAIATSCLGKTLSGLKSSSMIEAPWANYSGDWCAVFTSWLLRSVGAGSYQTYASGQFGAFPAVASPAVGDIIYYPTPGHVGMVVGISGGVPSTIEGNVPDTHWSLSTVRLYNSPWRGGYQFSRPPYAASSPTQGDDDMPKSIYYVASSNNASGTVLNGDTWVRATPGAPLVRVTSAQIYDYFVMESLDFNSPNVKRVPGSWFDTAFADDNAVRNHNVAAHPWMA